MGSTCSGSQAFHSSSASATTNLPQFHPIHMKLHRHNYAFWRAQVPPTIRAHGFEEYISPTGMPPPPFLPSASGVTPLPNPEYSSWIRKDQFLLSWFLSSIGDSMLGHVIRCNTARDVWITLDRLFLSQSKARMMQLRMALQSTRKGAQSIEEYFLKMRSYADQLSAICQVVSDDELQMYILAGFGVEYEALVVNFMQRSDTPTLQEMQLAFQAYELRLAQQLNHVDIIDPSANALFYGGGRGAFGRGSGRGASGSKVQSIKAVVCQLCGKIGHVALKCFRRFDVHFTGNSESETMPHQALMVESGCPENEEGSRTWYIDSGATNHVTNELSNLSINAEYQGNEAVMVGNGTSLPISSIGKTLPID